jgi:hypothetical protein
MCGPKNISEKNKEEAKPSVYDFMTLELPKFGDRNDVLAKNLMRAMKRFYTQLWFGGPKNWWKWNKQLFRSRWAKINEIFGSTFLNYFTNNEEVQENIPIYEILTKKLNRKDSLVNEELSPEDAKIMLLAILLKTSSRKFYKNLKFKQLYTSFYNVIDKYSTRKLIKLKGINDSNSCLSTISRLLHLKKNS